MKKVLATIGLASLAAASLQAQGLVTFSSSTQNVSTNNSAGLNSGSATIGKTEGAGNYYFALFDSATAMTASALVGYSTVGATPDASSYAWNTGWTLDTDSTALAASTGTAGRWAAVNPNNDSSLSTTVPGIAALANAYFVVVGWSANLGTSFSAMTNSVAEGIQGYVGQSVSSGAIVLGNETGQAVSGLSGAASSGFIPGFALGPVTVPEPGTLALAAIGGASLLALRRKK